MSEEKTVENTNFTKEEMDTILDCVMEVHLKILKERVEAPYNMQEKLSSLDTPVKLKTFADSGEFTDYLEHNKALDERADYLRGIINKLTYLCKADDLQEVKNNKE